jgi:hypothetical protein
LMFIDKEFDLYLLNNQQTLRPNISLIADSFTDISAS